MSVGMSVAANVAATGFLAAVHARDDKTKKQQEFEGLRCEFKKARERRPKIRRALNQSKTIGAKLRH